MTCKQQFLPESLYGVDSTMSREKLRIFYENNSTITGKVIRLDSSSSGLIVDLGNDIIGFMPFEDSTIYPIYKNCGISPAIYELVGKTIQAKILALEEKHILLSRKENMLEALEYFKSQSAVSFAEILDFSDLSAFLDIGAGITARSYGKEFSPVALNNIKDIGLKIGNIIPVNITNFYQELLYFNVTRKIPSANEILNEGDTVVCKVFHPVNNPLMPDSCDGYYVLINKNFAGIVDTYEDLEYGEEIVAIIKKITPKGVKLVMVER